MKLCIPYTSGLNCIMKCLSEEMGIEFITPPSPGRYTAEIGAVYSAEEMCAGIKIMTGSLAECFYLGADTALIFGDCGLCTSGEIAQKLRENLSRNGLKMKIISFSPEKDGTAELLKLMRKFSDAPIYKCIFLKKEFNECLRLADEYADICCKIKAQDSSNSAFETFLRMGNEEINKQYTLSALKIMLRTLCKKAVRFEKRNSSPMVGIIAEKYSVLDFSGYSLRENFALMGLNSTNILTLSTYFKKRKGKNEDAKNISSYAAKMLSSSLEAYKKADGLVCAFPSKCAVLLAAKGIVPEVAKKLDIPVLSLSTDKFGSGKDFYVMLSDFRSRIISEREKKCGAILFGNRRGN